MANDMRNKIVEVLRDFDEVKQIGPIADRIIEELGKVMVSVDPGGCAPPVYVSALPASPAGQMRKALTDARALLSADYGSDGRVVGVSHEMDGLRRMVAILDAALATEGKV